MTSLDIYLQIISILIALIAVAIPVIIVLVGFVYIRQLRERIDNLSGEVDELWSKLTKLSPPSE